MQASAKVTVAKHDFLEGLGRCMKETTVIAPVKMKDGEVTFEPVRTAKQITFDYVNDHDPLKRFFMPAREELFSFQNTRGKALLKSPPLPKPRVFFGIRSCDLQGLAHLDHFFQGAFEDQLYLQRRKSTLIISLACNEPLDTCFCICCNGGPFLESGFDLQLTDLGESFLVDIGSRAGRKFLDDWKVPCQTAKRKDEQLRQTLMQKCDETMIPTAYLAKACIQITNNRVREEVWDEMGAECFSCGGCTHVCPCCSCFDVFDCVEGETGQGTRYRCWDSCQYSGFTREASGHNPRAKAKERVKRRFYHKLSYAYIQQDGHPGCVGCGRCITVCEAFQQLDVPAVVKRLRRDG